MYFFIRRYKRTKNDRDYLLHRNEARSLISERVSHYSAMLGVSGNRIAIKNHQRRWGSCSSLGNLNFNYRLLFLPECLRDYVIVHELCHLKEFNHSERFWREVERVLPHYRELVAALRALERDTRLSPERLRQHLTVHSCSYCRGPFAPTNDVSQ